MALISGQLEVAFGPLTERLDQLVDGASLYKVTVNTSGLRRDAGEVIAGWTQLQTSIAAKRAEAALEHSLAALPPDIYLNSGVWRDVQSALPAAAGASLLAASFAAIPMVVSFARVSTGVLGFIGFSAISWPIFAVGSVAVITASITGLKVLTKAKDHRRQELKRRLRQQAAKQVFGIGLPAADRCVLNDLQAIVIKAGRTRVRGLS